MPFPGCTGNHCEGSALEHPSQASGTWVPNSWEGGSQVHSFALPTPPPGEGAEVSCMGRGFKPPTLGHLPKLPSVAYPAFFLSLFH